MMTFATCDRHPAFVGELDLDRASRAVDRDGVRVATQRSVVSLREAASS